MGYSFTFRFKESDIDFSPKLNRFFNYDNFLLNEFFNSSDKEMLEIMHSYKKHFGDSSFNYVLRNHYWGWRHGNRTMTNVQQERILYIMPVHLNEIAKQKLLNIKEEASYKLGIEEILGAIKRTVQSFFQYQSKIYSKEKINVAADIQNIFHREIVRVKELNIPQQQTYNRADGYYVLNDDEKKEALQIAQYIVYVKLKKQLDQIYKDFNTFLPFMFSNKRGIFSANYFVTTFSVRIDITKSTFHEIKIPTFLVEEIQANSRFKSYSDKYLALELVSIHSENNKAIANAFLNSHDLNIFFEHCGKLSLSDSEVTMKSIFHGEGGTLNIQVQMKPIKMLITSIIKSSAKILIYTIVFFGIVSFAMRQTLYPMLIFVGIYILACYIGLFIEELKKIKIYKSEIKPYGK